MQTTLTKLSHAIPLRIGVFMPNLGLGTWGMQGKEEEAVLWALENGYRHIDTAKIYGTEEGIGRAVAQSGVPREEIFITTKLWNADQGYDTALYAIDESLSKLNTNYVDLYLVHWPLTEETQGENRRQETWRAMETIFEQGKALAIGVSNFGREHLEEMESYAGVMPMVNQIERHPFNQSRGVVEYCDENGIAITNYSPLVRGTRSSDPTVEDIANKHHKSDAQVLIRWGIQHGNAVIPKAAQLVHIEENMDVYDFILDEEDMAALDALDEEYSVV